jgi:hypothetical protein
MVWSTNHRQYMVCSIIILSAFGPAEVLSQRVNQMLRVPNLNGDARRIHGDLSWFGQRNALRPAGRGSIVFPCT